MSENGMDVSMNEHDRDASISGWEDAGQYISTDLSERYSLNDNDKHNESSSDDTKLEDEPVDCSRVRTIRNSKTS